MRSSWLLFFKMTHFLAPIIKAYLYRKLSDLKMINVMLQS